MAQTTAAQPTKLPFWRSIGQAYGSFFSQPGIMVTLAARWLLIIVPVYAAMNWWIHPTLRGLHRALETGRVPPHDPWSALVNLLGWLAMLVPMSVIAVGWHRWLLRGEPPEVANTRRFGGPVGPYVAMAAILAAIGHLPSLALQMVPPSNDGGVLALRFGISVAVWVAIAFTARLSVALPAIAVEGPGATMGEAWQATRGNTLRLLFGLLITLLPMLAISAGVFYVAAAVPDRLVFAVIGALLSLASLLLLAISIGFWSYAWRHFFGEAHALAPS